MSSPVHGSVNFVPGCFVEIFGLESEAGKALNGKRGIIAKHLEERGRFEVELGHGKKTSVKPCNLHRAEVKSRWARVDAEEKKDAATTQTSGQVFKLGQRVEVFGLESEGGRALNGKMGPVTKYLAEKGRFQVELGLANVQSIKPENLRVVDASFVTAAGDAAAGSTKVVFVDLSQPLGAHFANDLKVNEVAAELQASKLGISKGWRALAVDGRKLTNLSEFVEEMGKVKAAGSATARVDFELPPTNVTFAERPLDSQAAPASFSPPAVPVDYSALPFRPGHVVEVFGLDTETDRALNGEKGVVTGYDAESESFSVSIGAASKVLRASHLKKVEFTLDPVATQSSGTLAPGLIAEDSQEPDAKRSRSR